MLFDISQVLWVAESIEKANWNEANATESRNISNWRFDENLSQLSPGEIIWWHGNLFHGWLLSLNTV